MLPEIRKLNTFVCTTSARQRNASFTMLHD
jgi:hypothetical protein